MKASCVVFAHTPRSVPLEKKKEKKTTPSTQLITTRVTPPYSLSVYMGFLCTIHTDSTQDALFQATNLSVFSNLISAQQFADHENTVFDN